jgi:polyisoprenoid-binding protein YceI
MKNIAIAAALSVGTTVAVAAPVSYSIDPNHSSVTAEVRHFGTSTLRTRFAAKSGTITIDPAAKTGSAIIDIDMASILTGVPALDESLKSSKFFSVSDYPDSVFKAIRFTFDGDRVTQIVGDLTMHGKTGSLTLTSTNYNCYLDPFTRKQVCGGDFEGTMQRSAWDVGYVVPFVSDETKLKIQVEATKD